MEGGRRDREVSAVRKWKDGGMEIGVSGGEREGEIQRFGVENGREMFTLLIGLGKYLTNRQL